MTHVINAEAAVKDISPQTVRLFTPSFDANLHRRPLANMVLFITSPLGAKISGQALSIDGHTETMRT